MSDDEPTEDLFPIMTTLYLGEECAPDYIPMVANIARIELTKVSHSPFGDSFYWEGVKFFCKVQNEPLPRNLYHPIASTTVFWPEAVTALAPHKAVLHIVSKHPRETLIQGLANQTILARAFMDCLPVLGVQFGHALTSPKWFEFLCGRLFHTGRLPIPAWIKIQMSWENHKVVVSTVGMTNFGLMEMEINPSPLAMDPTLDVVQYTIGYLLNEGPVVADGDTMSLGDGEEGDFDGIIRVHHAPSFRSDVGTVYLIEFL